MDADDLEPRRQKAVQKNLEIMGIGELEAYVAELEAEIVRARSTIAAKQKQRGTADALFKR